MTGPRYGNPTPLYDLMDKAPTFQKKMEVIKKYLPDLSNGQRSIALAMMIKVSDETNATNWSIEQFAEQFEISRWSAGMGQYVLRCGSPEQVAAVKNGRLGVNSLGRELAKATPLPISERRYKGSQKRGRKDNKALVMSQRADMWFKLRAGLEGLTSLPLPAEMVAEVNKMAKAKTFTDERLDRALNWLKDFADAYRSQGQESGETTDQDQDGDDHADPGAGSRVA